ncbi:hypothetical protein Peur_054197 [Populus x canadensis]
MPQTWFHIFYLFNSILLIFTIFYITPISELLFFKEVNDYNDLTKTPEFIPMPPVDCKNEKSLFDEKDVERLAPEYAAAATMLKGEAVFAKIDATNEIELGKMFKIKEYPAMYVLVNGGVQKVTYDLTDERTSDAITTWVRQKMSLAVQNVTTIEAAERILAARSVLVMGFFGTLEGSDSEELAAVAKQHIDVNFYQTANAEVARLFQIDPQIKQPALVMLKLKWMTRNHNHFGFDCQFTRSEISNFVSENKLPSVITFSEEDAPNIFKNPMKQLWLFAATFPKEVLAPFIEAADHLKGKLVGYTANGANKHVYNSDLSFNGIKVDENELKEAQAKYDEDRQRWQEERKDLTASQSKIRGPSPLPFLFSVSVEKE